MRGGGACARSSCDARRAFGLPKHGQPDGVGEGIRTAVRQRAGQGVLFLPACHPYCSRSGNGLCRAGCMCQDAAAHVPVARRDRAAQPWGEKAQEEWALLRATNDPRALDRSVALVQPAACSRAAVHAFTAVRYQSNGGQWAGGGRRLCAR